jgi:hypothetical protein
VLIRKNKTTIHEDHAVMEVYSYSEKRIFKAIIDIEDVEVAKGHTWHLSKRGYVSARINKKLVCFHKIITEHKRTDHIDGDTLNNRKINLRECTQRQNVLNRGPNKIGTSRYKGVHWNKRHGKWDVQCSRKWGGRYDDEKLAASAYNLLAKKLHGEYARLNIIPENE